MVLLFNVFLTNVRGNMFIPAHDRGNLPSYDKISIVKYSLNSLSKLCDWKKVIIKIELDSEYKSEEESLKYYVEKIFEGKDIIYSNKRNTYQKDWIETYEHINDDLILYLGNHDHIFVDSDVEYINKIIFDVKQNNINNVSIGLSHWPEAIRSVKTGYIDFYKTSPDKFNDNYNVGDLYASYDSFCIDSLLIITKTLYKEWFLVGEWGDFVELPRTDGIGKYTLANIKQLLNQQLPIQNIIIPYKELFRHFDGYMHQHIDNDICPSLSIPDGFFESKIKIRYGYDDRKDGWVNINPKSEHFFAKNKNGADYKFTLEDIPYFWQDKIIEWDINQSINEEEMIQHKLYTILKMMYFDVRYNQYIDLEIEKKVLYYNLRKHKNYTLI